MTKLEIIRAHPELSAPEMVARFGGFASNYHEVAKRHGLTIRRCTREERSEIHRAKMRARCNTARKEAYLREHYGKERPSVIAQKLGVCPQYISMKARRLGLSMTPEQAAAMKEEAGKAVGVTRRRHFAYLRARQLSGEERPTRVYNAFRVRRSERAYYYLARKYGYFCLDEYLGLGYDSTTDRCTEWSRAKGARKPEEYYTKKYGIHFYDLEGE